MARSPEHLVRLDEAVALLWTEPARQRARELDAALESLSVFWGEEDGEPYIEWAGDAQLGYTVRLHSFLP